LVIGDATSLTEAGYVGDDVESLLSKLMLTAEGDMDAAHRGIVYIDEIDKIKTTGSGFKDMRLGVQHGLLKLLEGTIATVPPQGGYKHPQQPGVPFDTAISSSSAVEPSSGWKTSSPSVSGEVGLGSTRCPKTARWRLMGCSDG